MLTDYHAKYIAHELTRRCASDSVEKLTAVLSDAQVDLNPHQIEAALKEIQRKLRGLETKRDEAWRDYNAASRDADRQKDGLLDEISRRLEQKAECHKRFSLRWRLA